MDLSTMWEKTKGFAVSAYVKSVDAVKSVCEKTVDLGKAAVAGIGSYLGFKVSTASAVVTIDTTDVLANISTGGNTMITVGLAILAFGVVMMFIKRK